MLQLIQQPKKVVTLAWGQPPPEQAWSALRSRVQRLLKCVCVRHPESHGGASNWEPPWPSHDPKRAAAPFFSGLLLHRAESSLPRGRGSPALSEVVTGVGGFRTHLPQMPMAKVRSQTFLWRLLPWLIVGLSETGGRARQRGGCACSVAM